VRRVATYRFSRLLSPFSPPSRDGQASSPFSRPFVFFVISKSRARVQPGARCLVVCRFFSCLSPLQSATTSVLVNRARFLSVRNVVQRQFPLPVSLPPPSRGHSLNSTPQEITRSGFFFGFLFINGFFSLSFCRTRESGFIFLTVDPPFFSSFASLCPPPLSVGGASTPMEKDPDFFAWFRSSADPLPYALPPPFFSPSDIPFSQFLARSGDAI